MIGQENDDDECEAVLTAVASYTSMRRILDVVQDDAQLLAQIEEIMYPCLLHSLTADGLDSIEEGVDCITMLAHHGYKDRALSPSMWRLYP